MIRLDVCVQNLKSGDELGFKTFQIFEFYLQYLHSAEDHWRNLLRNQKLTLIWILKLMWAGKLI